MARLSADAGTACWHTEAIHNANLTADLVGAVALGNFGVGNVHGLLAGTRAVDPRRKRLYVVAVDADHHGSIEEVAIAGGSKNRAIGSRLPAHDRALGNGPDDAPVAGAAVTLAPFVDPRPQPRRDRRVLHSYCGPRRTEPPKERQALLQAEVERLAAWVQAHLTSSDPSERATLLVAAAPPGVGKSYSIAALGAPTTAHPLTRTQPRLDR